MKKLQEIKPKKIAIFRALQLGDLLCSIPAIRALKYAFPESELTLIGLPWAKAFAEKFSDYFSGFIHFPGYPGLPEQNYHLHAFINFMEHVNEEKFDLILQLHGNGSIINPMISLLGAKRTAGYIEPDAYCTDPNLYMIYPEHLPEVERHLSLMKYLGVPLKGKDMELPISPEEEFRLDLLMKEYGLRPGEYVCIHPGARDLKRWWDSEKFACVADRIAGHGYKIVLTGTEIERSNVSKVEDQMEYPAINCAGRTDLGTLAGLVKNARMVFSNDTGVSHVAAAVKTPSVVVFLTSDPLRWAPLNKELHKIILPEQSEDMDLVLEKTAAALSTADERQFVNNNIVIDYRGKELYE